MSPRSFRHVTKRGSIYQYQRRVPKAVLACPEAHRLYFRGQSIYRKSLGTGLYSEALARASTAEIEFDGLVAAATGNLPATHDVPSRPKRALDAAGLAEAARHVRDREVRDWRRDIVRAEIDPEAADYLNWRLENAIAAQQDKRDSLVAVIGSSSVRETARQLNVDLGFWVDERSEEFGELIRATSDGYVQARADVQDLLQGKSLPDAPSSTLITAFGKQAASQSKAPKFTEVASAQAKVANYAPKTIEKVKRAHRRFLAVVGDKPIDAITRQDVQVFLDAVAAQTVGKLADTARPVSRNTVQSYLTQISSPLAFAIGRG